MNAMVCAQARPLLEVYADGELDTTAVLELERHLTGCADCSARLAQCRAVNHGLRSAPYHRAPDTLRARVMQSVAAPAAIPQAPRPRDWRRWSLPLVAGLALAVGVNVFLGERQAQDRLIGELVAGHVRSLQAEHLEDVRSSDHHTVKPWFAGRLDFAPPVRDFAAQGYALAGGRLDYLHGRAVAALVYRHGKHSINLFLWPAQGKHAVPPELHHREGYALVHWAQAGLDFWAVSDTGAAELMAFAQLQYAAGAAARTAAHPGS